MNKKLIFALAALLGFSTACSSVKNAPVKSEDKPKADSVVVRPYSSIDTTRRIIVMYGVRRPIDDSIRRQRLKQMELLDPVMERMVDDTPVLTPDQKKK